MPTNPAPGSTIYVCERFSYKVAWRPAMLLSVGRKWVYFHLIYNGRPSATTDRALLAARGAEWVVDLSERNPEKTS